MTLARRIFNEKQRIIYPLIAALVVNVALMALVLYPLSKKVERGQEDARVAAAARIAARRDYDSARSTVTGRASADIELQRFYSAVLPPDQSAARRITFLKIDQLARTANLQRERGSYAVSREHDSPLEKLTRTLVLTGQYRNIRRFIYELETAPEFIILENVALAQDTEADRDLNVTVQVGTYYRANDH